jgi:hypothetical protein
MNKDFAAGMNRLIRKPAVAFAACLLFAVQAWGGWGVDFTAPGTLKSVLKAYRFNDNKNKAYLSIL